MIDAEISSLVQEWRPGQARYSETQFEQLENKNNETYDDAKPKPSQWNAMAPRKPQDSVTNNPMGCRPSVQLGLERGRGALPNSRFPIWGTNQLFILEFLLRHLQPPGIRSLQQSLSPSKQFPTHKIFISEFLLRQQPPPHRQLRRELWLGPDVSGDRNRNSSL